MLRALYIGRFQPLHMGHVKAIEHIMRNVDELVIVIGSAQKSHTLDNPFTAGERIMMVRAALRDLCIDPLKYYLIPIADALMHSIWVSKVIAYSPPVNMAYSNEPLTSRLFKEAGIKVEKIPLIHRKVYSATEARRRMMAGSNWRELLPQGVIEIIDEIEGLERLQELALVDTYKCKI